MEDWDLDQRRRPAAARPVRPADVILVVVVIVLLAVGAGVVLRAGRSENPFDVPAATGTSSSQHVDDTPTVDPEQDAAIEDAAALLLGDVLHAVGPDALNLSPAQTVILRNRDTELHMTPGRVTAGTAACTAGPLLTVAMSVQVVRGSANPALDDFTMLGRDGSVKQAVDACSSGFVEATQERTVVFAAAQPGRLAYGPDPDHPIAIWHLT